MELSDKTTKSIHPTDINAVQNRANEGQLKSGYQQSKQSRNKNGKNNNMQQSNNSHIVMAILVETVKVVASVVDAVEITTKQLVPMSTGIASSVKRR